MEVKINKDIRTYSESFFFGLTLRQSVFMLLAIAAAVTSYLCLKGRLGTETVSWVCILCAVPFAALGFINYHGLTAEKLLKVLFRSAIEPRRLTVKTYDMYSDLMKSKKEEKNHAADSKNYSGAGKDEVPDA